MSKKKELENVLSDKDYEYYVAKTLINYLNIHAYYYIAWKLQGLYVAIAHCTLYTRSTWKDGYDLTMHPKFIMDNDISKSKPIQSISTVNTWAYPNDKLSELSKESMILVSIEDCIKKFNKVCKDKYECASFMKSETDFSIREFSMYYLETLSNTLKTLFSTMHSKQVTTNKKYDVCTDPEMLQLMNNVSYYFDTQFKCRLFSKAKVLIAGTGMKSSESDIPNANSEDAKEANSTIYKYALFDTMTMDILMLLIPQLTRQFNVNDEYQRSTLTDTTLYYNPLNWPMHYRHSEQKRSNIRWYSHDRESKGCQ